MSSNNTQTAIAKEALDLLDTLPEMPKDGQFLSRLDAQEIVDSTINLVANKGDSIELTYLRGHRKRLIETLCVVPKAKTSNARFLDIGCYGYFSLWAVKHLGYGSAVGTEMPLSDGSDHETREIKLGDDLIEIDVFHFNLTDEQWPLKSTFDTAICLEVLEHIDQDPSGVLDRVRNLLKMGGEFVLSVPNGVSYKTLGEMLSGMPPWTYWFYNPDLSHEPRHSLEYTPFTMALVLRAAGFEQSSFKTIDAYKERETISDLYRIGEKLGFDMRHFGETMIATSRKTAEKAEIRYPDAIYSGNGYYESTWHLIEARRKSVVEAFEAENYRVDSRLAKSQTELRSLEGRLAVLQSDFDSLKTGAKNSASEAETLRRLLIAQEKKLKREVSSFEEERRAQSKKIESLGAQLDAQKKLEDLHRRDSLRLMLYQLLSPSSVRRIAEKAELPPRRQWRRILLKHPFRVSEWRSLKRLHRRMKNKETKSRWNQISDSS